MENETEGGNGKEGTLTPSAQNAIGDAAKANVNAAVEVAAVSSFVDVFTGERKKPQRGKSRSTRKKTTSRGAASKLGKTKRSAGGRRAAAASSRRTTRKASGRGKAKRPSTAPLRPAGPHGRPLRASVLEGPFKRSEAPRNPRLPKLVGGHPSAARAENET